MTPAGVPCSLQQRVIAGAKRHVAPSSVAPFAEHGSSGSWTHDRASQIETPSLARGVQCPLAHCPSWLHTAPLPASVTHWPSTQPEPLAQSAEPEQLVAQTSPAHSYGAHDWAGGVTQVPLPSQVAPDRAVPFEHVPPPHAVPDATGGRHAPAPSHVPGGPHVVPGLGQPASTAPASAGPHWPVEPHRPHVPQLAFAQQTPSTQ